MGMLYMRTSSDGHGRDRNDKKQEEKKVQPAYPLPSAQNILSSYQTNHLLALSSHLIFGIRQLLEKPNLEITERGPSPFQDAIVEEGVKGGGPI